MKKGIQKCIEILAGKIEKAKTTVEIKIRTASQFGMYDDCGDDYNDEAKEAKIRLKVLNEEMETFQNLLKSVEKHEGKVTA